MTQSFSLAAVVAGGLSAMPCGRAGSLQLGIVGAGSSPHLVVVVDLVQDQPLRADAVVGAQPEGRPPAPRILCRHRSGVEGLGS